MKKRPFYNIAHHCNTESEVNENIEKCSANAIELDITPILQNGEIKFKIYHSLDFFKGRIINQWTPVEKVDSYFRNVKRFIDNKKLALIMFDCKTVKNVDEKAYAIKLLELLEKHDIKENFCLISVAGNAESIKKFFQGLNEREFKGARDACLDGYAKNSLLNWVQFIKNIGVTYIGLGDDPKMLFSFMSKWLPWIEEVIKLRDSKDPGELSKVFFWTLNTKSAMRTTLNYGVDGIIANFPNDLNEVLSGEPYCTQFRLATQEDDVLKKYDPLKL